MNQDMLRLRSRVVTAVRDFFLTRDYLELDTPLLSPAPLPESCLELFPTHFANPFVGELDLWLLPSPEVWMKQVIATERQSVFQLCKAFRNSESIGRIHSPEFTMLEYYTLGARAADAISLTEELFTACAQPETPASCLPPFRQLSMRDACLEFAGLDLLELQDPTTLAEALRSRGLTVPSGQSWEDSFNQAFVNWVEPALPQDRPLVLKDYPAQVECLAANIPGTPWKDRWELYAGGVELANCYTELASREAVLANLRLEGGRKQAQAFPHPVDLAYADLFSDFPLCTGVAMGFERMLMALAGAERLSEVLLFPFEASFNRWGRCRS